MVGFAATVMYNVRVGACISSLSGKLKLASMYRRCETRLGKFHCVVSECPGKIGKFNTVVKKKDFAYF